MADTDKNPINITSTPADAASKLVADKATKKGKKMSKALKKKIIMHVVATLIPIIGLYYYPALLIKWILARKLRKLKQRNAKADKADEANKTSHKFDSNFTSVYSAEIAEIQTDINRVVNDPVYLARMEFEMQSEDPKYHAQYIKVKRMDHVQRAQFYGHLSTNSQLDPEEATIYRAAMYSELSQHYAKMK